MKMYFYYQVRRAERRARYKWYKFYAVSRYGAPGRLEFICPETGMVAKTIEQDEAASYRRYWRICATKSAEILQWLNSIDEERYNNEVHSRLIRLLITGPPIMREATVYQEEHPFVPAKQWQESFVNFTSAKNTINTDGP